MLNWFLSKTVRQATDMKRQVVMLLNEQRDILKAENIERIEGAIASMNAVLRANPGKEAIQKEMASLETVANANFKPYASAAIRENVKEIMVAITTIMAFTNFFLMLTKIPTGSMQPTLYGITDENILDKPEIPNFLGRVKDYWVSGIQYNYFVAPVDGVFEGAEAPRTVFPFVQKQRFKFAGQFHTLWFPGEGLFGFSESGPQMRAVVKPGVVKKGDYVFATKVYAGDHLLVDRFTYNFRKPDRGEIVVFKTRGIEGLVQDQLYIKRLVGLPGETVQVGDDQHLVIDHHRLSASDRRFEWVYSFDVTKDPLANAKTPDDWNDARAHTSRKPPYRGHVNDKVARDLYHFGNGLAPLFADGTSTFKIKEGHYMAMGDNTLNSRDSREWGDFDRKNMIGKCWFVYWPITDRFGWNYR
jgi:signal peptidase I